MATDIPLYKKCLQTIPQRYICAIMNFFVLLSVSTMTNCLPLTITQMVKPIFANESQSMESDEMMCPLPHVTITANGTMIEAAMDYSDRYDWSEELQGLIMGLFYVGYVLMHIPGALIAERIGGKLVLVSAMAFTTIFTLLTPICVNWGGATALIGVRMAIGTLQGGMWPAVSTILSAWLPMSERNSLAGLAFCGLAFGIIVGNYLTGILLDVYQNWEIVFYVFGAFGVIVTLLFMVLCSSSPSTHPFITEKEKIFLQKEMGQLERDKNLPSTPWRAILTSRPVIVSAIDMCLNDWAYFIVMIALPKYMNDVLHVSVRQNGVYSSVPWAMRLMVTFTSGYWADWVIKSGRLSVTHTRKLFIIVAAIVDGSFMMLAAYAGCDANMVGLYFIISAGSQGLLPASTFMVPMDLSPNYAGTITAITDGLGSITGVFEPWIFGLLTPNATMGEWRLVFWISFGLHVVKLMNFTLFGSAKVQPWDSPEQKPMKNVEAAPHK